MIKSIKRQTIFITLGVFKQYSNVSQSSRHAKFCRTDMSSFFTYFYINHELWPPLELPKRGNSNEDSQHMIFRTHAKSSWILSIKFGQIWSSDNVSLNKRWKKTEMSEVINSIRSWKIRQLFLILQSKGPNLGRLLLWNLHQKFKFQSKLNEIGPISWNETSLDTKTKLNIKKYWVTRHHVLTAEFSNNSLSDYLTKHAVIHKYCDSSVYENCVAPDWIASTAQRKSNIKS